MKIDTNALILAKAIGGGTSVAVEPLAVTENGEYTAPSGKAYSPVNVSVPTVTVESLSATENGTYTAPTGKAYSPVTVSVPKPDYLISDGDNVSTFYFNTAYALGTWLATLTYSDLDPGTGLYVCYTGLGYFYGVDLTSGQYALVWNDGVNIVPIYSTIAVPSFGVTEAGWQMASYTPSVATTVVEAQIISALWAVIDDVVAKDGIAFGIELPQLNAPSISISQNTLNITNPSTNGNFATGYKVFADGVLAGTTSTSTFDLSSLTGHSASITAKAVGSGFADSADSSSASWTRYLSVSFYDGSSQMTGSPVSVAYGSTVAQAMTAGSISTAKTGYDFNYWCSDSGLTTEVPTNTQVMSAMTLYGKWTESLYLSVVDTSTYSANTVGNKAYSPSGKWLVAPSSGSTFYIYDTSTNPYTRKSSYSLSNNSVGVYSCWVSDELLVTVNGGDIRMWSVSATGSLTNVTSSKKPSSLPSPSVIMDACKVTPSVSDDGYIGMYIRTSSTYYVYLLNTTTSPFTVVHSATVTENTGWVEIMRDGTLLFLTTNRTVYKYNKDDYTSRTTAFTCGRGDRVYNAFLYRVGDKVYISSQDSQASGSSTPYGFYVYSYSNGTFTQLIHKNYVEGEFYAYNIDGKYLKAVSGSNGSVTVYNANGTVLQTLSQSIPHCAGFSKISPDGKKVLLAYNSTSPWFVTYELKPTV